jgi:hypothetical protein
VDFRVIIVFSHSNRVFGMSREPARGCPCGGGADRDHWDICREGPGGTIDTDHPVCHFASHKLIPVDALIRLARIELDAVGIDRTKGN